jgi:hypothetical protein
MDPAKKQRVLSLEFEEELLKAGFSFSVQAVWESIKKNPKASRDFFVFGTF